MKTLTKQPEFPKTRDFILRDWLFRLPFIRSRHQTSPPYYIGSVVENRLGLQVARVLGKRVTRALRRRIVAADVEQYVQILERDGVVAIENFLPAEEFRKISDEFAWANEKVELQPYKNAANARLFRTQLNITDAPENYPSIIKNFQANGFLKRLVAAVLRRNIEQPPDVFLDTYQNLNEAGADNDIENILHADLHTTTIKMFFYLTETDETNGAFVYAKGSHKLTFVRLVYEYDLSVREAKLKNGKSVPESLLESRSTQTRNIIRPVLREKMRVCETQICVAPNTLVVADNMGFHRRGEFPGELARKTLLINFRKEEKMFR